MLRRGGNPRTDAELYSVGATPHESKAPTASQRGVLPYQSHECSSKTAYPARVRSPVRKTHNLPSRLRPSRWTC
jgi:hypothetical protein